SDGLRDEAQVDNEDFINKLDDNIKKIIKEQVKEQVKAQVSKILPKIEKTINEQLEAKVLTRSSNESKTSYAIAANLSELELKKILIDKMEKSTSAPKEKTSKTIGKSTEGSKSHHKFAQPEEPMHTTEDLEEPAHQEFDTGFSEDQPIDETTQHHECSLDRKEDTHDSFNELMDTPLDFSAFVMNRLKVDTLTPELLAGPTFKLMEGSCKSLVELEYFLKEVYKATTDQLNWNNPEGQQYPHDLRVVPRAELMQLQ
ncbi:retrovirus-related pol polyprotein from transposon TNT 1-94, partial [Tanacetum coccineum]